MDDEDPPLEGHSAGQGGAIAQDRARPEHADDGGAVMGDGLLRCQGGTDDVDVGRHPEGGASLGLSGQTGLGLRRRDGQPTGRVRECLSNRRTVIEPNWGRSSNWRVVIGHCKRL
ncbi:MAG: hypothetical protein ACYDEY_16005 [Acidimicrobiales bacterium]